MVNLFQLNTTLGASDEISFKIEWDGTIKVVRNDVVQYTAPSTSKISDDFAVFPHGMYSGPIKTEFSGNLVDFEWPESLSTETPIPATPVKISGSCNIVGNHINPAENPMGKGGTVDVGSIQGAGSFIEFWPNQFHPSNQTFISFDTSTGNYAPDGGTFGVKVNNGNQCLMYVDGVLDHLAHRRTYGTTSWADHYNDSSTSYPGDEYINRYSLGKIRIEFYDGDYAIWWVNGYPMWRFEGIDVSQKHYMTWACLNAGWTTGMENIQIYSAQ